MLRYLLYIDFNLYFLLSMGDIMKKWYVSMIISVLITVFSAQSMHRLVPINNGGNGWRYITVDISRVPLGGQRLYLAIPSFMQWRRRQQRMNNNRTRTNTNKPVSSLNYYADRYDYITTNGSRLRAPIRIPISNIPKNSHLNDSHT